MATEVLNRPIEIIDEGLPVTDDNVEFFNPNGFPETIFVISYGNNKYAALNTTPLPAIPGDDFTVNAIASFANESEGRLYQEIHHVEGEITAKKFEEVVEIATSKRPLISAIALQHEGKTILLHYVN